MDAAATATVLAPDGWLTTGDFGRLTPEGDLQLSGRAPSATSGGATTSTRPRWKRSSRRIPSVSRATVVGVPDDVLGEVGVAVVVATGGGVARTGRTPRPLRKRAVRLQGPGHAGPSSTSCP